VRKILPVLLLLALLLAALLTACRPAVAETPEPGPDATQPESIFPRNQPTPETPTPTPLTRIRVIFIAGGDNGKGGKLVGCKDSAIPVEWDIDPTRQPLVQALEQLFSFDQQFVGNPRLYHPIYALGLKLESAEIDDLGVAHVRLSGSGTISGSCDRLRAQAQVEETILASPGVTSLDVTVNDMPLVDFLAGK
jgi:hypothetical protein